MRSRKLVLSIFVTSIAAMAFVIHSRSSDVEKQIVVEGVAERQPASAPQTPALSENPVFDESVVYQFDRRMKAIINKKDVLTDIHYSGYLFVDWKENKNDIRTGIFSFQVKDASIPTVFAEVKVSSDYRLISMKTPELKSENEENALLFLNDLISMYAFRSLEDTTGKYEASIEKISENKNEKIWMKKKIKYSSPSLAKMKFNQSTHEIHLGANLLEASGVEDAQMGELKTHGIYILKLVNDQELASLKIKKSTLNLNTSLSDHAMATKPNQIVKEKVSWEEVSKKLNTLSQLNGKARLNLFHDLVKAMKANPEKLQELMEWVRAGMNDKAKASLAIGLLASVGSVESQHELVQLYEQAKNNSPENAHLILNSFATSGSKVSPEGIAMMNSALDHRDENPELAANAAYALGAAGDVKKITELAEKATSKDEKIIYIDAIGNSGSVDSLPFLLESAKSSDALIREKAIFALRFVNDERVKTVFEQSMTDVSMSVRYAVVKAIVFQANPNEYSSLLKNCSTSMDKYLRSLCSQALVNL